MKKYIVLMMILLLVSVSAGCGPADPAFVGGPQNPDAEEPSGTQNDGEQQEGQDVQEDLAEAEARTEVQNQAQKLWEEAMEGCWTAADEQFAYFTWKDGVPSFYGGTWEDSGIIQRGAGTILSLQQKDAENYVMTVGWPPSATVMEVVLELSGLDRDGKVNLTVDGVTRTYAWGGISYDDAYDSVHTVDYANFEEVCSFWEPIQGQWKLADGDAELGFNKNGEPTMMLNPAGEISGRTGVFGKAMSPIHSESGLWTELVFDYNPEGNLDAVWKVFYFDVGSLESSGKIYIRAEDTGEIFELRR